MADVTIRGAGIFGLTLAWEALQRGASVRVIDLAGVGAGASGGVVGALQPHTPDPWNAKKQFQLDSLLMARDFWPAIEDASGLPSGYGRVGRLLPLLSDREVDLARGRVAAAEENWGDAAYWIVGKTAEWGNGAPDGWCPPSPTGLYVFDTLSAILHPRLATASLAEAVRILGGQILSGGEDQGHVIWATGWRGLVEMGAGTGVKGQAAVLNFDAAGAPQIYVDGIHIIPHLDGTVAIGSTNERAFDDPIGTDAALDDLLVRAAQMMPALAEATVHTRWAGVRPRAKSRAPLLGPWPGRDGHFIANGGFKIGFGMAPKCAKVLLDLVIDGHDAIPTDFHTDAL